MRVVYVIDSLAGGGAERSLAEMVPHLVDAGVSLTIAQLHDRAGFRDDVREAGAEVVTVAAGGLAARVRSLRRLALDRRADLVHTTLFDADVAGRLAARAAGVTVTGSLVNLHYGPESRQPGVASWKQRIVHGADAATARLTPKLHAVSSDVADVMARRLRYPRARIVVIPRGRDPERLGRRSAERREAARAGLGIGPDDRLVLAIGRHEHQKGFDRLLEAMPDVRAACPAAVLRIAGKEGRETASLRSQAAAVGLDPEAVFLGERADVPDLLCAADLFVLASRREGMPGALIEAMALEAPLLTSDLPVVRELLGEPEAASVVVPDGGSWATAIGAALALTSDTASRRARFEQRLTVAGAAAELSRFWASL